MAPVELLDHGLLLLEHVTGLAAACHAHHAVARGAAQLLLTALLLLKVLHDAAVGD